MPLIRQPFRSILLLVSALSLIYSAWHMLPVADWHEYLLEWLQQTGNTSILVYVAVYILATLIILPLSPLAIGAGYVYGPYYGFGITLVAATLGAGIAFIISRTLLRARFHRLFRSRASLAAVENSINDRGGIIVFLLRLSPVIPSQILNYLCGITGISLRIYLLATLFGKAPLLFLLSYIGAVTARSTTGAEISGQLLILSAGLITTGLACWLIVRGARRRLQQEGLKDG